MKRCLLLFVALFGALITQAQSIEWNRTFVSSSGDVAPYDVAVHSNDAIYVVGGFRRSTNFGGGYTLVPNSYNGGSNSDGFLVKLDGAGRTKWAKAIATDATSGASGTP